MVMFIQAFRYAYEPFVFAKTRDADNRRSYVEAMRYFIILVGALSRWTCTGRDLSYFTKAAAWL